MNNEHIGVIERDIKDIEETAMTIYKICAKRRDIPATIMVNFVKIFQSTQHALDVLAEVEHEQQ